MSHDSTTFKVDLQPAQMTPKQTVEGRDSENVETALSLDGPNTVNIRVVLNGKLAIGSLAAYLNEQVSSFDERLTSELSLPSTHRLVLRGRQLLHTPFATLQDAGLLNDDILYVIASSESEVSAVQTAASDPLLRGFSRTRSKYSARPVSTDKQGWNSIAESRKYGFGSVRALPGYADGDKAEALLKKLANDPGFLRVMENRKWHVGCLSEMEPHGKVGIDPVCVLGYNVNKGAEIILRLRTDDKKGFRPMYKLKEVLAHELAHNVHGEHDRKFYELMRQIEREARQFDWRESQGYALTEGRRFQGQEKDPLDVDRDTSATLNIVRKLGSVSDGVENSSAESVGLSSGNQRSGLQRGTLQESLPYAGSTTRVTATERNPEPNSSSIALHAARKSPVVGSSEVSGPRRTDHSSKSSIAPTPTSNKSSNSENIASLTSLGFSRGVAQVALRENHDNVSRAAEWMLTLSEDTAVNEPRCGSENASDSMLRILADALDHMRDETRDELMFETALVTLHAYVYNLLASPLVAHFRRINGSNTTYRERLGRYRTSRAVMEAIGFAQESDGCWTVPGNIDPARLWLVKSIITRYLFGSVGVERVFS